MSATTLLIPVGRRGTGCSAPSRALTDLTDVVPTRRPTTMTTTMMIPAARTTTLTRATTTAARLADLIPQVRHLSLAKWWRGATILPADTPPPSPLPSPPPPPTSAKEVARTCPIEGCGWSCVLASAAQRRGKLAEHVNDAHGDGVELTLLHAHGLHECSFCHLVLHEDPVFKHQYRICNGLGAPRVHEAEWAKMKDGLERNARSLHVAKRAEAARAELARRANGAHRVERQSDAPPRTPLGEPDLSSTVHHAMRSQPLQQERPRTTIAPDVLLANVHGSDIRAFFSPSVPGNAASNIHCGERMEVDDATGAWPAASGGAMPVDGARTAESDVQRVEGEGRSASSRAQAHPTQPVARPAESAHAQLDLSAKV